MWTLPLEIMSGVGGPDRTPRLTNDNQKLQVSHNARGKFFRARRKWRKKRAQITTLNGRFWGVLSHGDTRRTKRRLTTSRTGVESTLDGGGRASGGPRSIVALRMCESDTNYVLLYLSSCYGRDNARRYHLTHLVCHEEEEEEGKNYDGAITCRLGTVKPIARRPWPKSPRYLVKSPKSDAQKYNNIHGPWPQHLSYRLTTTTFTITLFCTTYSFWWSVRSLLALSCFERHGCWTRRTRVMITLRYW